MLLVSLCVVLSSDYIDDCKCESYSINKLP